MNVVCRVLIIGDSLFTETLARMLAEVPEVSIVGTVQTLTSAITAIPACVPHLIVVAAAAHPSQDTFGPLLTAYPDLAIICADLNRDYLQVITSRRVDARRQDLLTAIQSLHHDFCNQKISR